MEHGTQNIIITMSKHRSWVFTINNWNEDDIDSIHNLQEQTKYILYGKEVGEQGTPHLQGLIIFNNPRHMGGLKKLLPRAHLEPMGGTLEQASTYCKKEGEFVELGIAPSSTRERTKKGGKATQDIFRDALKLTQEGKDKEISELYPDVYVKYLNHLQNAARSLAPKVHNIEGEFSNLWIYGPPGSGKSRYARDKYPNAYIKDPTSDWWTNYQGQEVVIIDDFDKYQKGQAGQMKRWLDRYKFPAKIHFGQMEIRPAKIIVTSNYHPIDIWEDETTVEAICRRTKVIYLGEGPLLMPGALHARYPEEIEVYDI